MSHADIPSLPIPSLPKTLIRNPPLNPKSTTSPPSLHRPFKTEPSQYPIPSPPLYTKSQITHIHTDRITHQQPHNLKPQRPTVCSPVPVQTDKQTSLSFLLSSSTNLHNQTNTQNKKIRLTTETSQPHSASSSYLFVRAAINRSFSTSVPTRRDETTRVSESFTERGQKEGGGVGNGWASYCEGDGWMGYWV